jgi:hypothetical protein
LITTAAGTFNSGVETFAARGARFAGALFTEFASKLDAVVFGSLSVTTTRLRAAGFWTVRFTGGMGSADLAGLDAGFFGIAAKSHETAPFVKNFP